MQARQPLIIPRGGLRAAHRERDFRLTTPPPNVRRAAGTVKHHASSMLMKPRAANRAHAATLARECGLILSRLGGAVARAHTW